MKKHLFTLVMMLALVGTSASSFAAAGDHPSNADLFVVGSIGEFAVTRGNASNGLVWELFVVSTAADIGADPTSDAATTAIELVDSRAQNAAALGDGQTYDQGDTDASVFVRFKDEPAENTLFCLEVRETDANNDCVTKRRVYLSVFDFDVNVYWATGVSGDSVAGAHNGDFSDTISWHNTVIDNYMNQGWLTGALGDLEADSVNNASDDFKKIDSTYFAVTIDISSAPDAYKLDQIKWRFRYSMPGADNDSIYKIYPAAQPIAHAEATANPTAIAAPVFGDGSSQVGGASSTAEIDIPATLDAASGDWTGTNEVLVPATGTGTAVSKATYVFALVYHQVVGSPNPQEFDIRIDRAELEFNAAAGTNYSSGSKAFGASDATAIADGITGTYTVEQSPATNVITITH